MKIGIYSRKSRLTEKGESTINQINMCKEYARKNFNNIEEMILYEDEGYSGGSINRPMFKKMLEDANQKKFNVLICYRLDRMSRNISDFSNTIDLMHKNDIAFVSIREQFDTSTPMGRAMLYIASVFAQLERETIAERIRDNMLELAKTGRWLGGVTPTGFSSEPILYMDENYKQKQMFRLSPISEELKIVKLLYEKYLELKSLSALQRYCIDNKIKSKNNNSFTKHSLKGILINPVYAISGKNLYDYFIEEGIEVISPKKDFNGKNGLMIYNKTLQEKGKKNKLRKKSEWIVAIGYHEGIILSDPWIKVQKLLTQNKKKSPRQSTGNYGLLTGLIKCGVCGGSMRLKLGRKNKISNEIYYYYTCLTKEVTRKLKCNVLNIKGNDLDKFVLCFLDKLSYTSFDLTNHLSQNKNELLKKKQKTNTLREKTQWEIKENKLAICNLIKQLSKNESSNISKYISHQIEELDKKNRDLEQILEYMKDKKEINYELEKNTISHFQALITKGNLQEARSIIKNVIEKIIWNGKEMEIYLRGKEEK